MSRRRTMYASTFLSESQAKRLAAGRVVIAKVGEEHDGQQLVVRLTPHPRGTGMLAGTVEVSVTVYEWDHGGCMIGEEGGGSELTARQHAGGSRLPSSQHGSNLAASPPASAGSDGRAASALPAPPSPHQLRHRRSARPSGGGEVDSIGTEPRSAQASRSNGRDGAEGQQA